MLKTYTVPTRFVFEGFFLVEAKSPEEAARIVKDDCSFVNGAQSSVENVGWNFPTHPEKIILKGQISW